MGGYHEYTEGYHDECGGYHEYNGGCSVERRYERLSHSVYQRKVLDLMEK